MKTVWKFEIPIVDEFTLHMPWYARVRHAGLDPSGAPCIWAEVDPEQPLEAKRFAIVGTGNPLPDHGDPWHVGSFVLGPFVWHLYSLVGGGA